VAGLISFISPCVLPIVPIYIGYLTGTTVTTIEEESKRTVFFHALSFVIGFTIIFVVVFGAPMGMLIVGGKNIADVFVQIGGVFLILFGLHMGGVFRFLAKILDIFFQFLSNKLNMPSIKKVGDFFQILNTKLDMLILPERRLQMGGKSDSSPSYIRSGLFGMTFAAGWTPCIGPFLGSILTVAATGESIGLVFTLLFFYSMGLGIPFLLTALFVTSATGLLRKMNQYAHAIEITSAVFLIGIGYLLVTGQFEQINTWFLRYTPSWLY